jgi:hypothetical protein
MNDRTVTQVGGPGNPQPFNALVHVILVNLLGCTAQRDSGGEFDEYYGKHHGHTFGVIVYPDGGMNVHFAEGGVTVSSDGFRVECWYDTSCCSNLRQDDGVVRAPSRPSRPRALEVLQSLMRHDRDYTNTELEEFFRQSGRSPKSVHPLVTYMVQSGLLLRPARGVCRLADTVAPATGATVAEDAAA